MLNGETLADGVFNVNPRSNRDVCPVGNVVKLVDRKVVKIQCHTVLECSYFNRRFCLSFQCSLCPGGLTNGGVSLKGVTVK